MTEINLKQYKLTSGDEIICEVIDFDNEEDVVIVRAACKIVEVENHDEGYSYFAFRPYMSFTDSIDNIQIINQPHIICETIPSDNLLRHYETTLIKMDKYLKSGKTLEEMELMSDEEFNSFTFDEAEEPEQDPRGENIITLKPKDDTFH